MATNVKVRPRRNESTERLIRRFVKKVKKERVLEIYKEKTAYYVKPSIKKKMKQEKARKELKRRERKMRK